MAGETIISRAKGALKAFRESDQPVVSFAREILWVVAVVGGIALLLFLICGDLARGCGRGIREHAPEHACK